jgi:hypothetical protein
MADSLAPQPEGDVRRIFGEGATAGLTNLPKKPEGSPLSLENGDTIVIPTHPFEIVRVKANYPGSVP